MDEWMGNMISFLECCQMITNVISHKVSCQWFRRKQKELQRHPSLACSSSHLSPSCKKKRFCLGLLLQLQIQHACKFGFRRRLPQKEFQWHLSLACFSSHLSPPQMRRPESVWALQILWFSLHVPWLWKAKHKRRRNWNEYRTPTICHLVWVNWIIWLYIVSNQNWNMHEWMEIWFHFGVMTRHEARRDRLPIFIHVLNIWKFTSKPSSTSLMVRCPCCRRPSHKLPCRSWEGKIPSRPSAKWSLTWASLAWGRGNGTVFRVAVTRPLQVARFENQSTNAEGTEMNTEHRTCHSCVLSFVH